MGEKTRQGTHHTIRGVEWWCAITITSQNIPWPAARRPVQLGRCGLCTSTTRDLGVQVRLVAPSSQNLAGADSRLAAGHRSPDPSGTPRSIWLVQECVVV